MIQSNLLFLKSSILYKLKKNFNIYFTLSLYFPTKWTKVKKRSNLDVFI